MHFEKTEYLQRMQKTQEAMAAKGMDVLLVSDPANICYLSGHDAWSFYVPQGLIITLEDKMPVFIGRYMDVYGGVIKSTWLDEQHVRAYSDTLVHNPEHHPMERFAEVIKELGARKKTIAVEMDNYWFTARGYECLKANLTDAEFMDGNLLINWIRIIKSDKEIEYQRKAGHLASLAIQAGIDAIEAGKRQCDVVAAICHAQIHGTEEFGGDYPSIVPLLPTGEMAGAPHLTWSDERYSDNTVVAIEIAGCYRRYHSPLARTVCIGNPDPKVKDVAEIAIEGLEAALGAVKPGVYLEEMELAFRNVLKKNRMQKESRIGYSIGLNYPPDWGEHTASIRCGDRTILKPNMTFHCIPGMYYGDFGVSISEAFRVTENGYETFAHYPRKLIIKQ